MHFFQGQHFWTAEAVFKEIVAECGRSFRKHGPVNVYRAKITSKCRKIKLFGVNEERKNSVAQRKTCQHFSLEIGRYWERLHRPEEVAQFNLPNCIILLLHKRLIVLSRSTYQSVKHWKVRMTTCTWKWSNVLHVTLSVNCFFRRVFWRALLSSHTHLSSQRGLVRQLTIKQWVLLITQIFVFFSNIISRNREILRKITQNCGSGAVSFTKLHNLTPTKKFTRLLMIYTPVSKALKSANDNSRTRVAACGLRNAKRYLLFRGVFWLAFLSSHTHLPNQSGLVCQLAIKQWVPDHADFHVFFCFVLFSSGKRRPLMMVRSSALWKWTGESTMERDRTWRLLKLQLPSLLLKDWKRNTLRCTRKSKSQSGLGGHQCCSKGAFLDLYCWDNAVEHCYSNRK